MLFKMLFNMLSHWDSTNSMKAINSKNSINSMNPTNTTTMNKESYNIMDVPNLDRIVKNKDSTPKTEAKNFII